MKLVIQIPCYNEEESLPATLAALPREIRRVDRVEWLIIDDGSQDGTAEVAKAHGVDHIVSLPRHEGLAKAFYLGIEACLEAGADVIVNTDADNQYSVDDIPTILNPILDGRADIVIGARPIREMQHFSQTKKYLQSLVSYGIRVLTRTDVADATSGFRAMSRKAAMQLHVFSNYSYTLESIIQAGNSGLIVTSVPIRVNLPTRSSRLITSIPAYIRRQLLTVLQTFITYKPFRFFAIQGAVLLFLGIIAGARFLYFLFTSGGAGHVQSLILAAILILIGMSLVVLGVIADLIAVNRRLLEKLYLRMQKIEQLLANGRKGR